MNQDFLTMRWEQMPWWMKLLQLITVWAVICTGVCLPLITLKLYWKSIQKYFAGDFQSSPYERLAAQRQVEQPKNAKLPEFNHSRFSRNRIRLKNLPHLKKFASGIKTQNTCRNSVTDLRKSARR